MRNLQQIKNILDKRKDHLFQKYPIKSLAIFGSYARNNPSQESDLDILVDFDSSIGIDFIDLADELEQITGLKVDLVSKRGVKDSYLIRIERDLVYV